MRLRDLLLTASLPFVIATIAATLCAVAVGPTLGLYFGGMTIAALIVPPLAMRHEKPFDALIAAGSAIDGAGVVWLLVALFSHVTFGQWLLAYLLLAACGLALFAFSMLLRRAIGVTASSALAVIIALAWLSVPIWLSPTIVSSLAVIHPLFAINRVFIDHGVWTQQRMMYQLTTLGQDVPYSLPSSIVACAFAHVTAAMLLGWPAWWAASRGRRLQVSPAET